MVVLEIVLPLGPVPVRLQLPLVAPDITERTSMPSTNGTVSLLTGRLMTIDSVWLEAAVVVVVFLSRVGSDLLGSVVDDVSVLVMEATLGAEALGRVKYQIAKTTPSNRSAIRIMRVGLVFLLVMTFSSGF